MDHPVAGDTSWGLIEAPGGAGAGRDARRRWPGWISTAANEILTAGPDRVGDVQKRPRTAHILRCRASRSAVIHARSAYGPAGSPLSA